MKALVVMAVMIFGFQALAHNHEGDGKDFGTHKAEVLKHLDEKIAKLNEHKTCVTAAADKDAFKKCHESMKEFRHEKKAEWKEKREEMKEKRKEKKEKRSKKSSEPAE